MAFPPGSRRCGLDSRRQILAKAKALKQLEAGFDQMGRGGSVGGPPSRTFVGQGIAAVIFLSEASIECLAEGEVGLNPCGRDCALD